ncbi:MAG TPA: type II CAAX endopeptidase family protein [Myxococcota bacterium]|nr:type II CAAX endopeptidase family protein [Myxococcota bacterium]
MSIEKGPAPEASGPASATGEADPARLVGIAIVFYGLLFAAALIWTRLESRSLWLRSAGLEISWLRDVSLGVITAAALVVASRALTAATSAGRALADALARVLGRPGLGACLALAAISGLAEEAFFRGALQPRVGLVVASGLFAAAHLAPRREFLPWPFFAFAAGLAFGVLFDATGNLVAPVVAHAGINAWNLRWLAMRTRN